MDDINLYFESINSSELLMKSFLPYHQVGPWVKNRSVLDYGCGFGGGSYVLARYASWVKGYDRDSARIEFATTMFVPHVSNLSYSRQLEDIENQVFDIVCLFNVLNEDTDVQSVASDLGKFLKTKGLLFLGLRNDYELQMAHLMEAIALRFKHMEIIWSENYEFPGQRQYLLAGINLTSEKINVNNDQIGG